MSYAEVAHGTRIRLWRSAAKERVVVDQVVANIDDERDDWPTVQRHRAAGTWEGKTRIKPSQGVFGGLMP